MDAKPHAGDTQVESEGRDKSSLSFQCMSQMSQHLGFDFFCLQNLIIGTVANSFKHLEFVSRMEGLMSLLV